MVGIGKMVPELKRDFDTLISLNSGKILTEDINCNIIPSKEFHPHVLYDFFNHAWDEGFKQGIELKEYKILNFNLGLSIIKNEALEYHPMIVLKNNPLYSVGVKFHTVITLKHKMTRWEKIKTLFSICTSVLNYLSDEKYDYKSK